MARPASIGWPNEASAAARSASIVSWGKEARPSAYSSARSRCMPGRDDLGEEADRVRLLGVEDPAGEDDVERPALADDARQALRAAVDERDAPAALGEAEPRVRVADAQVAPQRELEAAGEAPAADRGDRRLRARQAGEAERAVRVVEPRGRASRAP